MFNQYKRIGDDPDSTGRFKINKNKFEDIYNQNKYMQKFIEIKKKGDMTEE